LLAVAGLDDELRMPPPEKKSLTTEQVAVLRTWIEQGAKWPKDDGATVQGPRSSHWAFRPIRRPALPSVKNVAWVRNDIDRFVLARLEKEGIAPSPEADRITLVRRLSFDLTGLPPTPEEVERARNDWSEDWYEHVVDRLLASPHYGERWGRHWLDLARYADSDGYEKDTGRPFAWRWRNWVIDALNADKPFDQFTIEQLAGDLLPGATVEQKVATGFHRNTLTNKEGGVDQEQFRVEACVDRVNTTAKVWLGVTMGCAQCHDHKYDPLSQREYYQFFAFFNSDAEINISAPIGDESAKLTDEKAEHDKKHLELQKAIDDYKASKGNNVPKTDAQLVKLTTALTNHDKNAPTGTMAQTLAIGKTRPTHVMVRGDFLRKGVEVKAATPGVLTKPPVADAPGSPNRLDLAKWIVAAENPLTSRVLANWVWHKYFGRGIVATLEDFGTQGEKPTHPELLDFLATEIVRQRWSLKALHREIVTSATYRQSSRARPDLVQRDPLNTLLARQARLRLEAEGLRDTALAVSGLLTTSVGGPSVRPPQPPGISELTYANSVKWVESTGPDRYRRGLYIWFQRTSPYPMLMTFDAPDSNVCVVRREKSNTPLQALTLLNDAVFVECAQAFAQRIMAAKQTPEERLRCAFRLCVAREPAPVELSRLLRLHDDLLAMCKANPAEAAKLLGKTKPVGDAAEAATWVALARTLLNLDEAVTRE
jgi:hypothetical protein